MELGLNLGLNVLTDEELADCFDEFCACGKAHDADALKKQRAHARKQLQLAHDQRLRAIPSRLRFGACGAYGITARAYHWEAKRIRYVEVSQHGKQPECLIYADGTAVAGENSQFYGPGGVDRLLEAFGVESPEQLFSMFFPT
jgi:cytochrome b involved in lipid metabolism